MGYKVEGKQFDNKGDALEYAETLLLGKLYDDYVMVSEWQDEGFWEPVERVERDSDEKNLSDEEWDAGENGIYLGEDGWHTRRNGSEEGPFQTFEEATS